MKRYCKGCKNIGQKKMITIDGYESMDEFYIYCKKEYKDFMHQELMHCDSYKLSIISMLLY